VPNNGVEIVPPCRAQYRPPNARERSDALGSIAGPDFLCDERKAILLAAASPSP
jgi:hypothetical protein